MEAIRAIEEQQWTFDAIECAIKSILDEWGGDEEHPEAEANQEELELVLQSLADAESSKADAISWVVTQYEAQTEAIKQTEQSLANRRRSIENRITSLKSYALRVMQMHGVQKIKGQSATLSIRKGTESVYVDPGAVESLPFDLVRTKVEADKTAIKEALKSGREVTGCSLQVGPDTLSIRRA